MADTFEIQIVTPSRLVVREEVEEAGAPGAMGGFGVLPGHAPFMSAIRVGEIWTRKGSARTTYVVANGWAEVSPGRMIVLVEGAEKEGEIDAEHAEEERRYAEDLLAKNPEGPEAERAQTLLEWAELRLTRAGVHHPTPGDTPTP